MENSGQNTLLQAGSPTLERKWLNKDKASPYINENELCWFAMRDLKRPNAADPAYKMLTDIGFEVFTPLKDKVVIRHGERTVIKIPVIFDLLFVHSKKVELDKIEEKTTTLQYRYFKGGSYRQPIIVPEYDMNRFINAVRSTESPKFYLPGEITPDMVGKTVLIHGGPLNGYEVPLRKMQGSKTKRIFVDLPLFVTTEVELKTFDYLESVKK